MLLQIFACRNVATAAVNKHVPTSSSRFRLPIEAHRQTNPVPRNTASVWVCRLPGSERHSLRAAAMSAEHQQVGAVGWSLQQKLGICPWGVSDRTLSERSERNMDPAKLSNQTASVVFITLMNQFLSVLLLSLNHLHVFYFPSVSVFYSSTFSPFARLYKMG